MNTNKTTEARWVHLSAIQGHIAMWAVRQSPYHRPDGLLEVLTAFRDRVASKFDVNDMASLDRKQVNDLLSELHFIPEFEAWNKRKNGRDGHGFCSRYDKPKPDDDFIDLGALIKNVSLSLFRELDRDFESDQRYEKSRRRGALIQWLDGWRCRLFRPRL